MTWCSNACERVVTVTLCKQLYVRRWSLGKVYAVCSLFQSSTSRKQLIAGPLRASPQQASLRTMISPTESFVGDLAARATVETYGDIR